jgi:hypothetical protein
MQWSGSTGSQGLRAHGRGAEAHRWSGIGSHGIVYVAAAAVATVAIMALRLERAIGVAPASPESLIRAVPTGLATPELESARIALSSGESPAPARSSSAIATSAAPDSRDKRKEKDFYTEFVALAAQTPDALERAAPGVLSGEGPDCEKVALLRALHDSGSPRTGAFFALAIASLPDASSAQGESVPRFALRFLSQRVSREPDAKRALESIVWSAFPPAPSVLRRDGAIALASAASESELWRVAARLSAETDQAVRQSGIDALANSAHADAAKNALHEYGLSPTIESEPHEITDG